MANKEKGTHKDSQANRKKPDWLIYKIDLKKYFKV